MCIRSVFTMKKIIIITGATSGMGLETLKLLAKNGHTVYGTARKKEDFKTIEEAGGKPLQADMNDYESLEKAVETIIKEEGRIDVLDNNAGYGLYGTVEEIPLKDAKNQLEVNLFGLARLTQLVIPHMRAQKSGTIINISSMGGKIYTPFGAWYHASKHALEGFSDCLRLELRHFGIHVVVVEPGSIATPWNDIMRKNLEKYSTSGPYKETAENFIARSERSSKTNEGSPPSIIADVILKIVNARKPKTRYVAGKYAKLLISIRKFLGDRIYDKVIDRMIK